jgi:hypothetical protein
VRVGFTEQGERVLVGVCLWMRESHEDWLDLGRDLIARGLPGRCWSSPTAPRG